MNDFMIIHFNVPPGFADRTNYTFRAAEPPEAVSLVAYSADAERWSVEEILDRVRRRATLAMPGRVSFGEEYLVAVGSREGKAILMDVADERRFCDQLVAVASSQNCIIVISYTSAFADVGARARFLHLLTSVRYVEESSVAPANGFYRAHALGISLDIPSHLKPPSTFIILSAREAVRMRITVGDPAMDRLPSLSAAVVEDTARASSFDGVTVRSFVSDNVVGNKASYVWRSGRAELFVLLARLTMHRHVELMIDVRGPLDRVELCDYVFEFVVASLKRGIDDELV